MADRQGRVGIRPPRIGLGHEALPGDRGHRLEHALVADAAPAKLPLDHVRALGCELVRVGQAPHR